MFFVFFDIVCLIVELRRRGKFQPIKKSLLNILYTNCAEKLQRHDLSSFSTCLSLPKSPKSFLFGNSDAL